MEDVLHARPRPPVGGQLVAFVGVDQLARIEEPLALAAGKGAEEGKGQQPGEGKNGQPGEPARGQRGEEGSFRQRRAPSGGQSNGGHGGA